MIVRTILSCNFLFVIRVLPVEGCLMQEVMSQSQQHMGTRNASMRALDRYHRNYSTTWSSICIEAGSRPFVYHGGVHSSQAASARTQVRLPQCSRCFITVNTYTELSSPTVIHEPAISTMKVLLRGAKRWERGRTCHPPRMCR